MRTKKVRGHHRLQKQITIFFKDNIARGVILTESFNDDYIKFRIWPWSGATYGRVIGPKEPKGKTRELIFNGFLDIYDVWKKQLDSLNEPYYLKLWFYSPNVSKSEIVRATRNRLERYDRMFFSPDHAPIFNLSENKNLKSRLEKFNWEYYLDEEQFANDILDEIIDYKSVSDYSGHKNWVEKQLKKPHRTTLIDNSAYSCTEYYSFKKGDLWIGGN